MFGIAGCGRKLILVIKQFEFPVVVAGEHIFSGWVDLFIVRARMCIISQQIMNRLNIYGVQRVAWKRSTSQLFCGNPVYNLDAGFLNFDRGRNSHIVSLEGCGCSVF